MTIVDKILDELIKGTSLEKVRAKYKSAASLDRALLDSEESGLNGRP
jgi:hypothetical protein